MNNSKVVIFLSCLFAATLTAPLVTAATHGGGFSGGHSFAGRPGMGMPGRPGIGMPGRAGMGMPGRAGMGMPGRPGMGMPGRPGMSMPGRPGMGTRSGVNRHGGDFHHDHFDRDDHFNHHEEEEDEFNNNNIIFIGSFGFPWWWGWG